jgi:polyisoprenoid-binding protein YceI
LPEKVDLSNADSLLAPQGATTPAVRYLIEARVSRFTVRAFASGMLSAFGHNPTIAIRDFAGEAQFSPDQLGSASLHVAVKAASLAVTNDVSDKDRREIEREMHENVLESAKYPEIVYDCSRISVDTPANGQYSMALYGNLTLHGVTNALKIPARVAITGDMLRAYGEFLLRQSDYNIKLVSAIGGGLKVKDELKFTFDIAARKQE